MKSVLVIVLALAVSVPVRCLKELPTTHIADISNGKVFYMTGAYGEARLSNLETASSVCAEYGATLAYAHEVYSAGQAGLSKCRCGYLDESFIAYPMFLASPRCDDGHVGVLPCPIIYNKWQKDGWDAYCFLLTPGEKRRQAPSGAVDIGPGWVFHHQSLEGKRTIVGSTEAERQCNMKGATVANIDQLTQAQLLGFTNCNCGWLRQHKVAFSQGEHSASCKPSDCIEAQPPVELGVIECTGTDKEYNGFDVYCYRPKNFNVKPPKPPGQPVPGGYIFPIDGKNGHGTIRCREEGEELCEMHGATLATAAEYFTAFKSGELQDCDCAYLSNSVSFSIAEKGQCTNRMDDTRIGVFSCTENWKHLGFRGYRAYCFKGKHEERQPTDETGVPVPGGYVFLHVNVDSNHTLVSSREADQVCHGRGAKVATTKQLTSAKERGMTHCICGWLTSNHAAYPLGTKLPYCGNELGVIECPMSGKSSRWGAYCFQTVRLSCKKWDPRRLFREIFAELDQENFTLKGI